jgi:hypothetical protein
LREKREMEIFADVKSIAERWDRQPHAPQPIQAAASSPVGVWFPESESNSLPAPNRSGR